MESQTTKPEESKLTMDTTTATKPTISGSVSETLGVPVTEPAAATSTSTSTTQNLTTPSPRQTSAISKNNVDLRRLSDRALPPLPQQDPEPGIPAPADIPDRVITDSPPPEYMSLPNIPPANTAQRSVPGTSGGHHTTGTRTRTRTRTRPENYVIRLEDLYEEPDYVDCPHCRTRQKTTVRHQPTTETNVAAVACCLFCGILPGIIPFCCNWFNDIEHVCPNCVKVVARMPHDGKMQPVLPQPSKYQPSQFQPATGNVAH